MPVSKFSISLAPETVAEIELRGGERSTTINQCLSRYFDLLVRSRRELAAKLSVAEISLILDALNGISLLDPWAVNFIGHEVADAIRLNGADRKWEVDGDALIGKMAALNQAEKLALTDATERWWDRVAAGDNPEPAEALK